MSDESRPAVSSIPEHVMRVFQQHIPTLETAEIQESLLIRDGHFCGQKFRADGWTVIWFVEEHQLKVYGPDGGLNQVCRLGQSVGRAA